MLICHMYVDINFIYVTIHRMINMKLKLLFLRRYPYKSLFSLYLNLSIYVCCMCMPVARLCLMKASNILGHNWTGI